jgi:branched-subunit amino acid ABC-type transport system permease component
VGQALSYALPGIPYGCTFALVAIGLVLSYQSTGVFNFAFGAQAYVAAVAYAVMARHGLGRGLAGVLAILVLSPLLGLAIDRLVFSRIPAGNVAAKTIAALGLMVGLPAAVSIVLGPTQEASPPSLLFDVNAVVLRVAGTPIDGVQLATVVVTLVVVVVLTGVLRGTLLGLEMRAAVESPRLLRLQGVSSRSVTSLAWVVSSALAGLAGVLLAPRYATVSIDNYTVLLVAAIAAAAIAGLDSLGIAAIASIAIGVVMGLATGYAPAGSVWSTGLLAAIPFFLLLVLLAVNPKLRHLGQSADPMAGIDPPPVPVLAPPRSAVLDRTLRVAGPLVLVVGIASVATWVPSSWVFVVTAGLGLSLIFLSITLITGAAGQVSLCQATFAGVGAFTAGQLATNFGVPVILAALAGALVAAGSGLVAALPALRLRGLALSLSTLTLALLADAIAFPTAWIGGPPSGITVPRPTLGPISFATDSTRAFFVLVVVIVVVAGVFVRRLLRGATGRGLDAWRQSPLAAAGLGYSPNRTKVVVFALSAAVAGLGGGIWGSLLQVVSPADFTYADSLLFVVVVVAVGVRTVAGAVEAGVGFAIVTHLAGYLPNRWSPASLVALAFSLGAFSYAAHPEGIVERLRRRATVVADAVVARAGRQAGPKATAEVVR